MTGILELVAFTFRPRCIVVLQLSWSVSIALALFSSRFDRSLYRQQCWPSASVFSVLEAQLSQPTCLLLMLVTQFPARLRTVHRACTNRFDGNWGSNQSGSMQSSLLTLRTSFSATVPSACATGTPPWVCLVNKEVFLSCSFCW
jgi:hypothetical protein